MSRLQKKCFIGATSMHVLLFVVLIVGPGFFSKDDPIDESDVLTFFPPMATDEKQQGGGAPPRVNPTPAPTIQEQTPAPPPPRVQETVRQPDPPPSRQPEREVEPEKEKSTPLNNRDSLDPKSDKPKPHQVQVNKKVVTIPKNRRTTTANSSNTDSTAQEQKERERFATAIAAAGSRAKTGLAPTTQVDMPEGPGGGGVSYANFAQIVRKVYTDAWRIPDDATDDEAVVKVSVTIARNGSVMSSRIISESGSKLVDRSIQNALDRVTTIGVAFPAGAKESQRTFTISFSLKAKKLLG